MCVYVLQSELSDFGRLTKAEAHYISERQFACSLTRFCKPYVDKNGDEFDVITRSRRLWGYGLCHTCEKLDLRYCSANNKEDRQQAKKAIQLHWDEVRHTREAYAEKIRLAMVPTSGWIISSWTCDAVYQVKTRLPSTASDAKSLQKLWRVK